MQRKSVFTFVSERIPIIPYILQGYFILGWFFLWRLYLQAHGIDARAVRLWWHMPCMWICQSEVTMSSQQDGAHKRNETAAIPHSASVCLTERAMRALYRRKTTIVLLSFGDIIYIQLFPVNFNAHLNHYYGFC